MPGKKFPALLYSMVNGGFEECGWTAEGDEFWISNPERLASTVIPQFFGHSSYASLHRSLNSYDFHKVSPSVWKHPLFHRDRPDDVQKIQRKTLSNAQKSIKQQLEHERRQAAILDAKAKELEDELREVQEADKAAQHKLQRLQEKAAAAKLDLNMKITHPFSPSYLEEDLVPLDSLDDMEMQLSVDEFDLSPQDLGLSTEDLKPQAARIIDDELCELFGTSCKVYCDSLWKHFEEAPQLSDEELRKAFNSLDTDGMGMISREKFQDTCLQLWKLGAGSSLGDKCAKSTSILRKMFRALEQAAQVDPDYDVIRLQEQSCVSSPLKEASDAGSEVATELENTFCEESLRSGYFRYEEFKAMMHAWKEWHGWKQQIETHL